MSEQVKTALIRALAGGLLTGAASAIVTWQTARGTMYQGEDTLLAFLTVFVGYLIARGVAEGMIDANRAAAVKAGESLPLKSDIVVSTARAAEIARNI